MKKLYSKILFAILAFFALFKKVLAGEVKPWTASTSDIIYSTSGLGQANHGEIVIYVARIVLLFPLLIISIISFLVFVFYKLRKKDINKIKSLIILGGLSFLSFISACITLWKFSDLINIERELDYVSIIVGNNLLLILTIISAISLFSFIYYFIKIIALFVLKKFQKKK